MERLDHELEIQQTMQHCILETLRQAILVLDENYVITMANEPVRHLWEVSEPLVGKCIFSTALQQRSRELGDCLRSSQVTGNDLLELNLRIQKSRGEERSALVVIRAVLDAQKSRVGTIIYAEDLSHQEKLRSTVQELEATAEELHSLNEELETTNLELQSTNEQLESTNRELNSLNEALEATTNELEIRTRELDEINRGYTETLEHMPSPILLVNDEAKIVVWNAAAQKLFGLEAKSVVGLQVQQLPLTLALRNTLSRRVAGVLSKQDSTEISSKSLKMGDFSGKLEMRFTPVNSPSLKAVLVVLEPIGGERPSPETRQRTGKHYGTTGAKKASAGKTATKRRK